MCCSDQASREVCSLPPIASTMTPALFGHFDGFGNLLAILLGITWNDFVLVPVAADRDLAAFAVKHLGFLAGFFTDTFEHRDLLLRPAAVAAQQRAIRVGTNDGDGLDLPEIERSQVVLVLQQSDGFMRGRQRESCDADRSP